MRPTRRGAHRPVVGGRPRADPQRCSARHGAPPRWTYVPPDVYILTADRPGGSTDEVSVEIHDNTLILRGERTHEAGILCWVVERIPARRSQGRGVLVRFVKNAYHVLRLLQRG